MTTKQTENRVKLDSIEANLREAAGVQDELVRKILTAMLQRQADHFRKLEQVERSTREQQRV
jgi:hypothetical protein